MVRSALRATCLVRVMLEIAEGDFPLVGDCVLELVDRDEVGLVLATVGRAHGPACQGILFGR